MSAQSSKVKFGNWEFRLHPSNSNVGVVLVHEIFGLDDYIESVAVELTRAGFWVAAVDLYGGRYAASLEEAFRLRASFKDQEVIDAIGSGLKLLSEKIGGAAKVGSMGFCMGGGFALLGACNLNMTFCADYYGMMEDVEQVKGAKGSIQLVLASEDERVTPWAYQHFLPAATRYKKRVDVYLYPNARHAFHRPNWDGHNPEAAKDAWAKALGFISQFK